MDKHSHSTWSGIRSAALLAALSLAVYFNALYNGLVFDDFAQVIKNYWIRDFAHVPEIFTKNVWGFAGLSAFNYYRPMMHMIFMACYSVFGLAPWGYHLANLLLHAGVTVLVYLLASRLLKDRRANSPAYLRPPLVAAVLFAVTPIHTEAVTWVSGIPEPSFTFFYLLSLYFYIKAVDDKLVWAYPLSVAFFFLAALSKETALTLPIIIFCYDICYGDRIERPVAYIKRYAPFLIVAAVYFALRLNALGGFAPYESGKGLTGYESIINMFPLFAWYIVKLLLPVNLNAFYVFHPLYVLLSARGIVSLCVSAVFVYLAFLAYRKNRSVFFCMSVIAVPLLPVLYTPGVVGYAFAERYLYLPSFGFAMLAAMLIGRLLERPKTAAAVVTAVILVSVLYSVGTVMRNPVWKDNYSIWSDTVRKSPDGAIPHKSLGEALGTMGRTDEAIKQFQIALKLDPDNLSIEEDLGIMYFTKGWTEKAVEQFTQVLASKPDYTETHLNLGLLYSAKGLTDKAIEEYRLSLKSFPDFAEAHYNLGLAYAAKGWTDKAIEEYRRTIELLPDYADAHYSLGNAYVAKGRLPEAIGEYKESLEIDPDNEQAHYNLGLAYRSTGSNVEAIKHLLAAVRLKPDDPDVRNNLGILYAEEGMVDKAVAEFELAVKLKPDNKSFRDNLERARKL